MRKFTIETGVKSVQGSQLWTVEAEDEKEAIKLFKRGEGEFLDETIEVTDLDEPRIISEEES